MTLKDFIPDYNPKRDDFPLYKLMAMLTPQMLNKMLSDNFDAGKRSGEKDKEKEAVRRLFASGMTKDEISILFGIGADFVSEIIKYGQTDIDLYTKLLKGRRYRQNKKRRNS